MRKRALASAGTLAAVMAFIGMTSVPIAGQARAAANTARKYVAPRTPWGDPDLQGNLTNLYEVGTPFERPDDFAGRQLEDVMAGEIGGTRWIWLDSFKHEKGTAAWFVVDPPDGKIPPQTADGQRRAAARAEARRVSGRGPADSFEDRSLYDRCITRGLPGSMMPVIYGNSYRIVQGPGFVAIQYEMVHETRVIPLDGRPHVGRNIRLDMGDPRGHFEGDTLVVETTNFRERSAYRGANPATLKLIERFTRIAPDKIRWTVTVDDSTTWVRPWSFAVPLTITDTEPIMEYACHEGNYAMTNILNGARAEERAAEEDAKQGIVRAPRQGPPADQSER
jgi:hypothetical protein